MAVLQACGPVLLPLLLLSVAVTTMAIDRCLFWWSWRRRPSARRREMLVDARTTHLLEPCLEAVVLAAPLLGLFGSVLALMRLFDQLQLPQPTAIDGYGLTLASTAFGLLLSLFALVVLLLNRTLRHWQMRLLQQSRL
jgi:biopolymer transport protein ExbB